MLPIPLASIVAFTGITAILVVTPGMSTALVFRNTAEGGRRAGVFTALGIAIGNTMWALTAGFGLAVILGRAPGALSTIRIVGVVCLTWLGSLSLRSAWRLWRSPAADSGSAVVPRRAHSRHLWEGAVTNLLNPSILVYYVATLPQFIGRSHRFAAAFALLSAIHVVMALCCHCAWAVAFGKVASAMASRGRAWAMHALTGAALIGLAFFSLRSM
jgi:threonine/homoserine/homoserine lactone efflux protein